MFCFAAVPALGERDDVCVVQHLLFCTPVWYVPYGDDTDRRALIEDMRNNYSYLKK